VNRLGNIRSILAHPLASNIRYPTLDAPTDPPMLQDALAAAFEYIEIVSANTAQTEDYQDLAH